MDQSSLEAAGIAIFIIGLLVAFVILGPAVKKDDPK